MIHIVGGLQLSAPGECFCRIVHFADELTGDNMTVDEMTEDETTWDKMTRDKMYQGTL
jgi:hypothetical protein